MTRVAIIQAASIPYEPMASVEKACVILHRVAQQGARLAVFPEAFIGGYPKGVSFGSVVGNRSGAGRELYERYVRGAVTLEGPELAVLAEGVEQTGVTVVVGIIERFGRTLYCTAVTLVPGRGIAGYHRKLMPTGQERLVWGFGDGSTIAAVPSDIGVLGSVICWENYMPALRQAMYAQGVQLYCAPTADDRDSWASSMVHVALEGRVFVLSACQAIRLSEYPPEHRATFGLDCPEEGFVMRGGSMIVSPLGEVLAGPVYESETELYADLDMSQLDKGNLDFDACGHYSRPDVFELRVNTAPLQAVRFAAE
ncbi:carbon-nitrogen hydrolase family protein [Pseudomonas aeruginosa]|uniref:carbon-nitrogen hydrolase family protein n=1 Tax=Pseudomonas aeruginosa TaxID=287 RepID=UPI00070B6849|nr:carbon-nitrogen hydrolase family protein [Pseudomonas aeruginosa]MDG3817882.1 carbon-nitrogen hydrolase family protein [Pseudomonas aeruginosa]NNB81528.1 carbon-nitrogen hydrolase family protein [Pseudomonas aeruginosa]RUB22910.1 carbon-nitrogen hydrolase family protein [Pseudomonas aeruginosa]HCD6627967.1 carbon-nitrogen hydrolase family protein [Pseudomonas aeruginosa]HCD7570059.1 carbon-nitrogen hydrolase family protein [Pseudomonas aeruginosa]